MRYTVVLLNADLLNQERDDASSVNSSEVWLVLDSLAGPNGVPSAIARARTQVYAQRIADALNAATGGA